MQQNDLSQAEAALLNESRRGGRRRAQTGGFAEPASYSRAGGGRPEGAARELSLPHPAGTHRARSAGLSVPVPLSAAAGDNKGRGRRARAAPAAGRGGAGPPSRAG